MKMKNLLITLIIGALFLSIAGVSAHTTYNVETLEVPENGTGYFDDGNYIRTQEPVTDGCGKILPYLKTTEPVIEDGKVSLTCNVVFMWNGVESYVGAGRLLLFDDNDCIKSVDLVKNYKNVNLKFDYHPYHDYRLVYCGCENVGEFGFNFAPTTKVLPIE